MKNKFGVRDEIPAFRPGGTRSSGNSSLTPFSRQRGFTLVTAIFVIVVLATIVGYMVSLSGTQRATSLLALQGARAYMAARSGIEWGTQQSFTNTAATCALAPASQQNSFTLNSTGLMGFKVTVTCSYTNHTEKSITLPVYHLIALAEYGNYGSPDYISRQVEATLSDAPP
jgi:MSHA biogenesis protein MshP